MIQINIVHFSFHIKLFQHMRIFRLITYILGLILLVWLYLKYVLNINEYDWLLFVSLPLLVLAYIFKSQIESYYYNSTEQQVDSKLGNILKLQLPGFANLDEATFYSYYNAIFRLDKSIEFIGKEVDNTPADIRFLTAACAFYFGDIAAHWRQEYGRIVLYQHPFLSPKFNEQVHITESEDEDGTIIFSVPHLVHGLSNGKQYLNIALYEYAHIYCKLNQLQIPESFEMVNYWRRFEQLGLLKEEKFYRYFGMRTFSPLALLATYYVYYPEKISNSFPEFHQLFNAIEIPIRSKQHT